MLEKIIVTLDGSASSETALGAASEIGRRLGSELVLLHVLERRPPKAIHGERHLASSAEAEAYLAAEADKLAAAGLRARTHVHDAAAEGTGLARSKQAAGPADSSAVARAVAEHEAEFGNDLVVMAAHGRRGAASALSSSLPLKVASSGGAAVLIVPKEGLAPRRILVPLDGRSEHEAALTTAVALAQGFGASLLLVAAIPHSAAEGGGDAGSIARLAPALSGACLEYAACAEADYLAGVRDRLRSGDARDVQVETLVLRGRPAKAIVSVCERGDLVALSSHRRLGLDASLDGCVAFEVARRWTGALLVAPIPREPGD